MKYYYTPGTIALAPHIALEMSGIDYQAIPIDFKKQQQRSTDFLAINPLGRVPALVTSEGVITEAPAILNYVCSLKEQVNSELANSHELSAFNRSKIDSFNSFLSSTVHISHAHLWRGQRWVDSETAKDEMALKTPQNMIEHFELIENDLFVGPWVHGDLLTSSDLYLFVITRWLKGDGVDPSQFTKVYAHYKSMLELKVVKNLVDGLYN